MDIMNPFTAEILNSIKKSAIFGGGLSSPNPIPNGPIPLGGMGRDIFENYRTPPFIDESGGFGGSPSNRRPDYNASEGRIGRAGKILFPSDTLEIPNSRTPNSDEEDIFDIFNKIYRAETKYTDMYGKGLEELPERNKPGVWRRIGASIVGMGGGDADKALYGPYYRQLADWDAKMKAIQPAMVNERGANQVERQAAADIARETTASRRATTAQQEADRRAKTDAENIKIRQDRVAIAAFRASKPTFKFFEDENGNLVGVDQSNPDNIEYITSPVDGKAINTGKLSEEEKINLQIAGRIRVARVAGEEARKTENTRSANDRTEIGLRGDEARETKKTIPGEDKETVTETTTAVTDETGAPAGSRTTRQRRVTQPAANGTVPMTRTDPKTGKVTRYNVPKNRVAEAEKDGLKRAK